MSELSIDDDTFSCLKELFVDDKSLLSGMYNSTADQNVDSLPTEDCSQEISQLDASSKMSEVIKDQDRSPGSNIVLLEGIGTCVASSTHVKCSSAMKDSILEENWVVLPWEACKIECNKFDTTLKLSELTKDDNLSPWLNMDSTTVLAMSNATNGTDISICSGGTDCGMHKMLEIHRIEYSNYKWHQ